MADDLFKAGEVAHARGSDPHTSHKAAAAATVDLRVDQARVADYLKRRGAEGACDAQMERELGDTGSSLRSRRAELTARNIILDSGRTCHFGDSARERIVWVHRDFHFGAPDVIDAPPPRASDEDRAAGRAGAAKLKRFADSLQREGRAMLATELADLGELMRRLSA